MNIQSEAWQGEPSLLLSGGGYSARILPRFGANCVSLRHESGAVLLREPKDPQTLAAAPNVYGLPLLFPPNRIRDGHFSFGGRSYDFPINEPARHHHIHGLLSTTPFSCEGGAAFTFRADAEHPYLSFPHAFTVTRAFALDEGGLVQTLTVRNDSALPMPLGTGFHAAWSVPLFPGQSPLDCRLHIPVRRHWLHDPQTIIPTGETVTDSPLLRALRESTLVPEREALSCLLELDDGPVRLITPRGDLVCTREAGYPFLMLWNGGGGQGFVCPEPQSWLVDAPNLPLPQEISGFTALAPGQSATTRLRYALELK